MRIGSAGCRQSVLQVRFPEIEIDNMPNNTRPAVKVEHQNKPKLTKCAPPFEAKEDGRLPLFKHDSQIMRIITPIEAIASWSDILNLDVSLFAFGEPRD